MPTGSRARASTRTKPEPEQGREVDLRKELLERARENMGSINTQPSTLSEHNDNLVYGIQMSIYLEIVQYLDDGKWPSEQENGEKTDLECLLNDLEEMAED